MQDAEFFGPKESACDESSDSMSIARAAARVLKPDRMQVRLEPVSLDERLASDHRARLVWDAACRLDLSAFYQPIEAREGTAGRTAIDRKLLVALWLYACIDGVGSGRELARLCQSDDAYRWLCGGVEVCYHTLNSFRVGHEKALDNLMTQVVGRLTHVGLVTVVRIAQDGTRVRASAGSGSYRREPTLRKSLQEAQRRVETLKKQRDAHEGTGVEARRQAHELRAAEDRLKRLDAALAALPAVAELKNSGRTDRPSRSAAPRISTTDPDARKLRMGDGGWRPAYNVQLAVDTPSRAIVGVLVSQSGTDSGLTQPMREQVEMRSGLKVIEQLTDGGYTLMKDVQDSWEAGVNVYRPPPTPRDERSPYQPTASDTPEQAMWRELMGTFEAQEIYRERASTIETVNADLKEHRGLRQFPVRTLGKVTSISLWMALAYNIMHFADLLNTAT
jgi:transposase